MNRRIFRIAALFATLGLTNTAHAQQTCDEQLVVFGDSLSDTGNVYAASWKAFPPSPPYADGRFTDGIGISAGLVWVEYLADLLGLARPAARLSNESPPTNYAFAGAVTGSIPAVFRPVLNPNPDTDVQGGAPLDDQIGLFLLDWQASASDPADVCGLDPANSLVVVWIGSNNILLLNEEKPGDSVKNIQSNIETLIKDTGATQFLVANMPDVSVTPGYVAYDSFFVAKKVIDVPLAEVRKRVLKFNEKLGEALGKIETKNPGVSIYRFDAFSLLNDITANPEDYGVNPNTGTPLLSEEALFINKELVLQNDADALFWDGVHPASNVHAVFAEAACRVLNRPDVVCEW